MKIARTRDVFTVRLGGRGTPARLKEALTSNSPLILAVRGKTNECGNAGSMLSKLLKHKFPVTGLLAGKAFGEPASLLLACDGIFWRKGSGLKFDITGRGEVTLLNKRLGREAARRVLFSSAGKLTKREAIASGWAKWVEGTEEEILHEISKQFEGLSTRALSILRELLYHENGLTAGQGETLERAAFALAFAGGDPAKGIEAFLESRNKRN